MNELIGKVRGVYKNILSQDEDIILDVNFSCVEVLDFTPSYKLDEDEWFKLINFSQQDFYINECHGTYSTASLDQIANPDYSKIEVIGIFQNGQKHFQRITSSLFINRKTFLDYSGAPRIVEQRNHIEIKPESDAIYVAEVDTLFFKSISKIKFIFPGIEILHREATQDEVDDFVRNDFIILDGIESRSFGVQNRKRIADIGVKYNALNNEKKALLITYARQHAGVELVNDAFKVKSEMDLKNVLYAMDQRYYYADIYEENRIASSIRVLRPQ